MKAYGYVRVSGKGQVEGDGFVRQEAAIRGYAEAHGLEVEEIFQEEGVSGTKEWDQRAAWLEMLSRIVANGVRIILVEKLDRVARDLMVQEHILLDLKQRGITLISAHEPDLCSDDPTRKLLRQIMGAIAEYDKAMVVLKLRGARERARGKVGKCEGRKAYGARFGEMEVLGEMRQMWKAGLTASEIARRLEEREYATREGKPWQPRVVARMMAREEA
jgi:DNA invertase Pin-like site-specific DNA recombinase